MKQENQPIPNSNLTDAQISDQARDEALNNFMHPEDKPKQVKKKMNWTKVKIAEVALAGIAVLGAVGVGVNQIVKSHEPTPVPEFFDPSAMNSVIGANNLIQIPESEYFASAPTIWNEQNEVMTMPLPIIFRDGRTPTLTVKKVENPVIDSLNVMYIQGLEQGDTIISPIDGEIELFQGNDNLEAFVLRTKDSQGENVSLSIGSASCLFRPLINFNKPITGEVYIPIKKGQSICEVLSVETNKIAELDITGNGPLLKSFSLATTSDGKAILLK